MSPAFSRDTVRESLRGGKGRGGGRAIDGRRKKNEPTRQSANLHTAHTGEEELRSLASLEGMIVLSRWTTRDRRRIVGRETVKF